MKVKRFVGAAMAGAIIALPIAATGAVKLPASTKEKFETYGKLQDARGYRAFAIGPSLAKASFSVSPSWPRIAVRQALADCRRTAGSDCRLYAVGRIVVHDLEPWQVEVATLLYQVKRDATNSDLSAVSEASSDQTHRSLQQSILFAGAKSGALEAIDAMLARGIDVDVRSGAGTTALMYAASRGQTSVVDLLLKRGAKPDTRNNVGKTALDLAELARNFAEQRNSKTDEHDAVIAALKQAGG